MGRIESVRGAELFAPEETGGVSLEDVFTAYMDCRRKKRGTYNALAFEVDWERRCADLLGRINAGEYRPLRSLVFIIRKPVMREVFAPAFESRVVDHLIARKIEPLLEERFIDDSYSTRKGKGTLFGIERMERHIRACSHNYTRDCYVMKLDIRSFFMDLPKRELYDRMAAFLRERYDAPDLPTLLCLLRATYSDCPQQHCVRRSPLAAWDKLPPRKSLFNGDAEHGLAIGRLTSQLGALFYLDPLDHLVTEAWGVPHYGRYVDDMVFVHESREHLIGVAEKVRTWLRENGLQLHPKKILPATLHPRRGFHRRRAETGQALSVQSHGGFLLQCAALLQPGCCGGCPFRVWPCRGVRGIDQLLSGLDAAFRIVSPAAADRRPYRQAVVEGRPCGSRAGKTRREETLQKADTETTRNPAGSHRIPEILCNRHCNMTEQELIDRQRARSDGTFYLMKVGMFYHAYDAGAYALARTMGYRVKCKPRKGGDGVLVSGFPIASLEKVAARMAEQGIRLTCAADDDRLYAFSGADATPDQTLVDHPPAGIPRSRNVRRPGGDGLTAKLDELILSFDLAGSTPMDAMNFVAALQRMVLKGE